MPRLFSKAAALCIALCMLATTANANSYDHTVLVFDKGFFPNDLYLTSGDTIRYISGTPGWRKITVPISYDENNNLETKTLWLEFGVPKQITVYFDGTESIQPPYQGGVTGHLINGVAPRQ